MRQVNKLQVALYSCFSLAFVAMQSHAAGYKLEFQSASTLADAGDAAVVEDVGTNWYNAAGLVYLPQQLAASGIAMYKPTRFGGTIVAPSTTLPGVATYTANGNASAYLNILLPGFHYGVPFWCNRFAFGISVVPAWGLIEDYGDNSIIRYDLSRVYTRTLDISPSLAWKINDQWSIGAGPDFHYFALQLKSHVRTQPLTTVDSISRVSTDDWGYGAHIGVLFRPTNTTRIGLNYRSKIATKLKGYSHFQLTGLGAFETNNFSLNLPMPPTTTLSAYQEINPCWAVMGTIAYDQWSVIRDMHGINFMLPTGTTSIVIPTGYRNTFDFSAGTKFRLTDQWLGRFSIKYVATPTGQYRDVTFPDGEKLGFNFGAHYQINKCLGLDLIYAHVFIKTVSINRTEFTGTIVEGHSRDSIDLAGAQIVWNI